MEVAISMVEDNRSRKDKHNRIFMQVDYGRFKLKQCLLLSHHFFLFNKFLLKSETLINYNNL